MRFAAFASGTGTNLQALIDAQESGSLEPATLSLVIVNRPEAQARLRGEKAGIPTLLIDHKDYESRKFFEVALIAALEEHQIEAVVLAGFMRILSPYFVDHFPSKIINTHPALCPAFPGIAAPQQALDAGVKITGVTVHLVDTGVDTGPIIFQEAVSVEAADTTTSLHRRIQAHEHALLPRAVCLLASGCLAVEGKHVRVIPR